MARAFEELFGIPDAFRGIPMPGRTDACILTDAAAAHGIAADSPELRRFHDLYLAHLSQELTRPGPNKGVMPGVRELLDALRARDDVFLALLTGNLAEAARLKLEYFDLWRYFECGAFGDDAPDRNRLLPRALLRVAECGGPTVHASQAVVIGDTPLDIACAAAAGARSIAVATGGYTVDALKDAGGDVVFPNLADTAAVLDAIFAERTSLL